MAKNSKKNDSQENGYENKNSQNFQDNCPNHAQNNQNKKNDSFSNKSDKECR